MGLFDISQLIACVHGWWSDVQNWNHAIETVSAAYVVDTATEATSLQTAALYRPIAAVSSKGDQHAKKGVICLFQNGMYAHPNGWTGLFSFLDISRFSLTNVWELTDSLTWLVYESWWCLSLLALPCHSRVLTQSDIRLNALLTFAAEWKYKTGLIRL